MLSRSVVGKCFPADHVLLLQPHLDDIAVSPAFRRQGIGRQLLDWAHGQFPESEFWLEVRESNAAAIALYESAG